MGWKEMHKGRVRVWDEKIQSGSGQDIVYRAGA